MNTLAGLGNAFAHATWTATVNSIGQYNSDYFAAQQAAIQAQSMKAAMQQSMREQRDFTEIYDPRTDSKQRVYKTYRAQLRAEVDSWLGKLRH